MFRANDSWRATTASALLSYHSMALLTSEMGWSEDIRLVSYIMRFVFVSVFENELTELNELRLA